MYSIKGGIFMSKKILIVGGVAGGASAAARLRRLDEYAEIVLFEKDGYISFANCGFPYYIGGQIKDREKLLVQTPEGMYDRFNIDVRINSEVTGIDTFKKTVKVESKDKGGYEESYDYLVLSPGAKAIRPNIEGINSDKILTLRNIPDTDSIKALADKKDVTSALVVGGGYVGVEMAENLKEMGLKVTLAEAAPHILAPFDTDIVVTAEKELKENGINLFINDGVKSFKDNGDNVEVTLNSNTKITADLVILSIGVEPNTGFLKGTGINLGPKGHILVNEKMETNIDNIYAVGDAVEVTDFVNNQKTAIALAGPANKQGRIAADNIAGLNKTYKGTQGTAILKIFGLTAASTGNNERTLKRLNIPYKAITVHPVSHASYYPGALSMTIKLIFNQEGKILGAQSIGYDGVDKRIDVIATVMRLGGTVSDLTELELAYAPPFSSAKDPVNMAGFVAENVITGKMDVITPEEFLNYNKSSTLLLDVRSEIEFNNGHLEGALNIPVDNLRDRLKELPKDKEIIEYCQVGLRGYVASRILSEHGYMVKNITGGYKSITVLNSIPIKQENKNNNSEKLILDEDTQVIKSEAALDTIDFNESLDVCGLCCPGPLSQVKVSMDKLKNGQILNVISSDPGFYDDIKIWCEKTNNELIDIKKDKGNVLAFIKKQ
jgi:NADPH-dependent 2,4-dienoyl-CoA reductase/sulfur reductase-like enzyme/rhodanese-related sulfurtransferase/TusA-related sulfurtransferase